MNIEQHIYLDNNATTRCDEQVLNAMLPYLKNEYGNPSSTYSFGKEAKDKITNARKKVAELLNADENEIIFTSCASESNVTAIMNVVRNNLAKKHIITTKVEHASIMETMKYLESIGYNITYLSVDNLGRIDLKELEESITDDTCLISIMMANNEIGNIYPIKEIGNIAKKHNVLFHCDSVQAVSKIKIDVKNMNIDTLSLSGHKINAPKGVGVLYIRDGIPYTPLIFGHQEMNRRGGTENVAYIVGLGKAVELILNDNYKSNTSSIAFKGIKAEELLLMLEAFNIYVSTGSACNSKIAVPSHVLTACGADLDNYSPIRVSLGKYNTKEEIDLFIKELAKVIKMLRKRG